MQTHSNPDSLNLFLPTWKTISGAEAVADASLIEECSAVFDQHYGVWGPQGPAPGSNIRFPPAKLRDLLNRDGALLACAFHEDRLIGYAASVLVGDGNKGRIAWVTQLVVDLNYRNEKVATQLLFSIWSFSDCECWGLVTANPFAVRALETATRRRCHRSFICSHGDEVLARLAPEVNYLPPKLSRRAGTTVPVVNTEFFVAHQNEAEMRQKARRADVRWDLGTIEEGEEWFACTFRSQKPSALSEDAIERLMQGADRIWLDAYSRMALDDNHLWHRHTDQEVDFVLGRLGGHVHRALDVGCGDGRHTRALTARGVDVTGIDIVPDLIARAKASPGGGHFAVADARDTDAIPRESFDAVLALYDVLGSSARPEDDRLMLRNLRRSLKPGGTLVLSVMNAEPTIVKLSLERQPSSPEEFVKALEALPASNTMASSGDVFDPDHLLVYKGIHYRKEQFEGTDGSLRAEHVVRDIRFTVESLSELLGSAGFKVQSICPVQAGRWGRNPALRSDDSRAKELLAFATVV